MVVFLGVRLKTTLKRSLKQIDHLISRSRVRKKLEVTNKELSDTNQNIQNRLNNLRDDLKKSNLTIVELEQLVARLEELLLFGGSLMIRGLMEKFNRAKTFEGKFLSATQYVYAFDYQSMVALGMDRDQLDTHVESQLKSISTSIKNMSAGGAHKQLSTLVGLMIRLARGRPWFTPLINSLPRASGGE